MAVPVLSERRSEAHTLMSALGALWVRGIPVDLGQVFGRIGTSRVGLPTYAFQRKRYWHASVEGFREQGASVAPHIDLHDFDEEQDGSLLRRLAEGASLDRAKLVLEAVREQVAAVLGEDIPDAIVPDRSLVELGFDSLAAIELRSRLRAISNLQISTGVIFECATPAALAAHVESLLAEPVASPRDADVSGGGSPATPAGRLETLTTMLPTALEQGAASEFMSLLVNASVFRPTFDASMANELHRPPARLAAGDRDLRLICVPTVLAMSGPQQYVGFARELAGSRAVSALTVPGFLGGERLPCDVEAAVEALALAVERRADDASFALVGHSSGGLLAHAVAARLERAGQPVAAVVLLDSYLPTSGASVGALSAIFGHWLEGVRDDPHGFFNDVRLTAMGAYLRVLAGWRPEAIQARTLLVRARDAPTGPSSEAVGVASDGDWRASWSTQHDIVDTPGDHFTMIEGHVQSTAHAVEEWLVRVIDRQGVEEVC